MNDHAEPTGGLRRWALTVLSVLLGGALAVAGVSFAVGSLMSRYEGEGGFAGFLLTVFGDAFRGHPAALALLLSPAAMLLLWWIVIRFWRFRQPVHANSDDT
ncbi:MAG: hypothetical protein QNJ73_16900 [Gammaproteobacteria bacterium]|nr:hypothetical protein [Gammaproteobacteria bacterium]